MQTCKPAAALSIFLVDGACAVRHARDGEATLPAEQHGLRPRAVDERLGAAQVIWPALLPVANPVAVPVASAVAGAKRIRVRKRLIARKVARVDPIIASRVGVGLGIAAVAVVAVAGVPLDVNRLPDHIRRARTTISLILWRRVNGATRQAGNGQNQKKCFHQRPDTRQWSNRARIICYPAGIAGVSNLGQGMSAVTRCERRALSQARFGATGPMN